MLPPTVKNTSLKGKLGKKVENVNKDSITDE